MKLQLSVTYVELFEEPVPELEPLIADIPSKAIITILSMINAQLYLGQDMKTQIGIIGRLLIRQSETTLNNINRKLMPKRQGDPETFPFSPLFTTECIHYELTHFRVIEFTDLTPEQELRLFKAYFVIADRISKRYTDSFRFTHEATPESFRKNAWPSMMDQFGLNNNIHPLTQFTKGIALFNFLQYYTSYGHYVQVFLKRKEKATAWNYMLDLVQFMQGHWDAYNDQQRLKPFILSSSKGFEEMMNSFSIIPGEYTEKFANDKSNFAGIKDRPLFYAGEGRFMILNWNFLAGKSYDGLVYDFYNHSDISNEKGFDTFLKFKNFIASEFSEKFLFQKLIRKVFEGQYRVMLFDDGLRQGTPDAYIRHGKYIFLIEFKDSAFDSRSINSLSYDAIKASIDKKFNLVDKGTGQLIKQLKTLKEKGFEEMDPELEKLKHRNLVIYPILIYGDSNFSAPGINDYLRTEFDQKIEMGNLRSEFASIEPIAFIHLSFLIQHIHLFSRPEMSLKDLVDFTHLRLDGIRKKNKKKISLQNLFDLNDSFESLVASKIGREKDQDSNHVATIVKALDLTENLPKGD